MRFIAEKHVRTELKNDEIFEGDRHQTGLEQLAPGGWGAVGSGTVTSQPVWYS
jgi:hypothetical protein